MQNECGVKTTEEPWTAYIQNRYTEEDLSVLVKVWLFLDPSSVAHYYRGDSKTL